MDHIFFLNINIGTYLNLKFQIADENGFYVYISNFGSSMVHVEYSQRTKLPKWAIQMASPITPPPCSIQ